MKSLPIVAWAALVPLAAPLSTAAEQLSPEIEEAMESFCALPAKLLPVLSSVTDKATADAAAEPLYRELSGVYEMSRFFACNARSATTPPRSTSNFKPSS